ncbi:MAG: Holliday junction resolvase RuvX [Candidatus Schekmanbacteria bacterium]|nr:Holliday junction resolvase RuvX [Candidatus Schekmanbacteria bacterium]
MRILGLDIGDRRIGVAVSDEGMLIARGLDTIQRNMDRREEKELLAVMEKFEVKRVVFGLPSDFHGNAGPQAEKTLAFVDSIKKNTDIPFVQWDERFSTQEAERSLIDANIRREKRKMLKDKVSAILILQGYLDSLGPADRE